MKAITGKRDLAINGAKPLFSAPLHVGRPNIGNKQEFLAYCSEILDRAWLTNNGPLLQELEHRIAQHTKTKHCVAMCNGTIALEIAIRAVGMAGEVIIPSYTFIATAHALSWQGITPVFADIDPTTHCIDPSAIERHITPRTTGIIGVHLWGRPCDTDAISTIARKHQLSVIYDAAHAFSASHQGKMIGSFGQCEVFSFHATKFFNTFEGGAVVTNDDELAERMRLMRNFGFHGNDNVIHPGTNGKLAEVNAAMGLVNLNNLERTIETNKQNHQLYCELLSQIEQLEVLKHNTSDRRNYQYVVICVKNNSRISRDELIATLVAENVLARKYFWPGCHKMKPYRDYYPHAGLLLPNTEEIASRTLVLPTGTTINEDHIHAICRIISMALSPD